MWFARTLEYYSVVKRREALTVPTTWTGLEHMMLSERGQTQGHTVCDAIDVTGPERARPQRQEVG